MTSHSVLVSASVVLAWIAFAQPIQEIIPPGHSSDGVYRAVERGPHHRTWERIVEEKDESGFLQPRTNSYVELGTGLHRWTGQEWTEASDEIEIIENGAVAMKSQHQGRANRSRWKSPDRPTASVISCERTALPWHSFVSNIRTLSSTL